MTVGITLIATTLLVVMSVYVMMATFSWRMETAQVSGRKGRREREGGRKGGVYT